MFYFVFHTHVLCTYVTPIGDEWESRGSIRAKTFWSSSHQLTIYAIAYEGLWVR